MSVAIDSSGIVALHFAEEPGHFETLENELADGDAAFTAPNCFQEVLEGLARRGKCRDARTAESDCYRIAPKVQK